MFYTGIGSRSTPADVLKRMTTLASALETYGYTLRSGGADGADTAFATGCTQKIIYIPWKNFNGLHTMKNGGTEVIICGYHPHLRRIAEQHHPAWARCSPGARALHTRNVAQVLGENANSPSRFVVCWTPGGTGSGGTGQAIRIARHHQIPIFDLGSPGLSGINNNDLLKLILAA